MLDWLNSVFKIVGDEVRRFPASLTVTQTAQLIWSGVLGVIETLIVWYAGMPGQLTPVAWMVIFLLLTFLTFLIIGMAGFMVRNWTAIRKTNQTKDNSDNGHQTSASNKTLTRIPLYQAAKIAKNEFDWRIGDPHSCDILDLGNGLRQAGIDGLIAIYGRRGCYGYPESTWPNFPLIKIPAMHLERYWLNITPLLENMPGEEITYHPGLDSWKTDCYIDLHVNGGEFRDWLTRDGVSWKGHTDTRLEREGIPSN